MNIKRYIADDATTAMEKIKEELGVDAVILSTNSVRRKGLFGFMQKPQVEVVVSYDRKDMLARQELNSFKSSRAGSDFRSNMAARMNTVPRDKDEVEIPLVNPFTKQPTAPSTPQKQTNVNKIYSNVGKVNRDDEQADSPAAAAASTPTASAQSAPSPTPKQSKQDDHIDARLKSFDEKIDSILNKIADSQGNDGLSEETQQYKQKLLDCGVSESIVKALAKKAQSIMDLKDMSAYDAFSVLLFKILKKGDPIANDAPNKTVIFFGPTGVGKTTTIAKLVAHFTIDEEAKVSIITADVFRIAAVAQIKTYADILNVPVNVAYTAEELRDMLTTDNGYDMLFVDTAGKSPNDDTHISDLQKVLNSCTNKDCYLVISATTSYESMRKIFVAYEPIKDYKLVVTKTDETDQIGAIINIAYLSRRPISYISNGQNVPKDIEELNIRKLIHQIMD